MEYTRIYLYNAAIYSASSTTSTVYMRPLSEQGALGAILTLLRFHVSLELPDPAAPMTEDMSLPPAYFRRRFNPAHSNVAVPELPPRSRCCSWRYKNCASVSAAPDEDAG